MEVAKTYVSNIFEYANDNKKKFIIYSTLLYSGYYIHKNYLRTKLNYAWELYNYFLTFKYENIVKTHVTSLHKESFENLNEGLLCFINEFLAKKDNSNIIYKNLQLLPILIPQPKPQPKQELHPEQLESEEKVKDEDNKNNNNNNDDNNNDNEIDNDREVKEIEDNIDNNNSIKNDKNDEIDGKEQNKEKDKNENNTNTNDNLNTNDVNTTKNINSANNKINLEVRIKLLNELKDSNFLITISGIFISRVMIFISQTNLVILENLNKVHFNKLGSEFIHSILTELWMFAKDDFIPYLYKFIEQRLITFIDKLNLKDKLTYQSLCYLNIDMKNSLLGYFLNDNEEIRIEVMNYYIDTIDKKIKNIEKENYDLDNGDKTMHIDFYIQFFSNMYDIFDSNLFNIVLVKLIDEDFEKLNEICLQFYKNSSYEVEEEISVLKIVKNFALLKPRLLTNSRFYNIDKLSNKMQEELEEYYKVIYS